MPETPTTPTGDPLVSAAQQKRLAQLTAMATSLAISRVDGDEAIYIGGIGSVMRQEALAERNITHILSVTLVEERSGIEGREHLAIEVHDDPEEDLLVHLPKAVRFINEALYPSLRGSREVSDDQSSHTTTTTTEKVQRPTGAVLVHCSAGRSRSVACVVAYLLWKHPETFGPAADGDQPQAQQLQQQTPPTSSYSSRPPGSGSQPVQRALAVIRQTRSFAEPNSGFMVQLERWWEMGCPDDVENHPAYNRWLYQREVDESVALGMAPTNLRFQDEMEHGASAAPEGRNTELRCKKCRRVLANKPFILDHRRPIAWTASTNGDVQECPHFFIEPLSWMRPTLELGELEGRLTCPGARCGASVGRYTWRGFRCSCNEWVTPAFSLQRSRVDEVVVADRGGGGGGGGGQQGAGIRMPPGMRRPVGGS